MILYHGSNIQNLKVLKSSYNTNKHIETNKHFIYLSPDKQFASCFCVSWNNGTARQGYFDGVLYFAPKESVDLYAPASIYIVDVDENKLDFINNHMCIYKGNRLNIKDEIKYKTGMDALKEMNVNIISYDEYMDRLNKRMKKGRYFCI